MCVAICMEFVAAMQSVASYVASHSSVTCTSQCRSRLAIHLENHIPIILNLYSQGSYVCTNV